MLSANPNITWDIVQQNPDKPWNWYVLSGNPNITWDIVQQNPDKPWELEMLSANPNITWDIVQQNPDKPWDLEMLSANPNITWDIVQQNPDKPWNWYVLSGNPNITWDIVQQNPRKLWKYVGLSRNPNITWDIIQQNPGKPWNWRWLSLNKMTNAREQFFDKKLKEYQLQVSSQQTHKPFIINSLNHEQSSEMSSAKKVVKTAIQSSEMSSTKASLLPVDNINLCFVGGVSTGKSTILNAIFCEQLTQCKIKRTTMVPTVYIENENDATNLDKPEHIFDQIAKKNQEIIEKTETGAQVSEEEYAEIQFNVGKIDINILPDSYVNVYDIPGLNDARTKSVYYKYLQKNFFRFNLVVFIVDIHSGLNTSDEADILNFIADHTKLQLNSNNKKIYTLVVVNKADDMQLVPESADDELEITGELGEMFDQVDNTVTEAFRLRNIADHLVGIIPLCAIDSYLYRMTQKHGSDFKLSPEQILKIGINENGKKFSTLKPKTQETRVREILNDKEFVSTMIKLSGFGHFEKLLHSFLSQNNTGKQIRIDNLLYELRKYTPLQEFTAKRLEELDLVAYLLDQYFQIFRAIVKIDANIGVALIVDAMHSIVDTVRKHIQTTLSAPIPISIVESTVLYYDTFRDKILTPYFAVEEMYPKFICDLVVNKLDDILNTSQLSPFIINRAIGVCALMGILTTVIFEKLNAAVVGNVNRFSAFIHNFVDMKRDNDEYLLYIKQCSKFGVDTTLLLRFVVLSRLCYKSYYSDKQLFQKLMIYKKHGEIPVYTYLQHITSKIANPSPEWFLYDVNEHITEQEAHQLDVYYLEHLK
jgi:GTP-binding protein EngB required for normal cell division